MRGLTCWAHLAERSSLELVLQLLCCVRLLEQNQLLPSLFLTNAVLVCEPYSNPSFPLSSNVVFMGQSLYH